MIGIDYRAALQIATAMVRAHVRELTGNRRLLLAVLPGLLLFGIGAPLVLFEQELALGRALRTGSPVGTLGVIAGATLAIGTFFGVSSSLNRNEIGSVGPLVRTSTGPATVVAGRFLGVSLQLFQFVGVPLVVGSVIVAIGARNPLAGVVVLALALTGLTAGQISGSLVGALVRYVSLRSRLGPVLKVLVFGAIVIAPMVAGLVVTSKLFEDPSAPVALPAITVPGQPFRPLSSVFLLGLGRLPELWDVITTVLVGVVVVGCFGVFLRVEAASMRKATGEKQYDSTTRAVPWPLDTTRDTRLGWRYLLRAIRNPKSMRHLMAPVFGVLGALPGLLVGGVALPRLVVPGGALAFGVSLAAIAFCLNPMGDERDQLPLIKTASPTTAAALRGRAVASIIPGISCCLLVGVPTLVWVTATSQGLFTTVGRLLLYLLLAAVFVPGAAGVALGIGALVPKFEQSNAFAVEQVQPSQKALFGVGLAALGVTAGGFLLGLLAVDGSLIAAVLLLLELLVVAGSGVAGYRYAHRRFDSFRLDEI